MQKRHRRRTLGRIERLESRKLLAAHLLLEFDQASVDESSGVAAITATLTRVESSDLAVPLTVALAADDVDEVSFPETVTIPRDLDRVTFTLDTISDAVIDGTAVATITASAVGNDPASAIVSVQDDDASGAIVIGGQLEGVLPTGVLAVSHTILVPAEKILTVQPATEIQFVTGQSLDVRGTLLAQGTQTDPVRFSSGATTPATGDWAGIIMRSSFDQQRSFIEHAIVQHAVDGILVIGQNSPVTIDSSEVANNQRNGLSVFDDNTALGTLVQNNHVHDNGENGIYLSSTGSGCDNSALVSIDVLNNELDHNGQSGIHMYARGSNGCFLAIGVSAGATMAPTIQGNRIHSNSDGITAFLADSNKFSASLDAEILNNFIFDNVDDGISIETETGGNDAKILNNSILGNGGDGIFHHEDTDPKLRIFNNLVAENLRGIATTAGHVFIEGTVGFNNVSNNVSANWSNYPSSFGDLTSVNANGTDADAFNNISTSPDLLDGFHISLASPNVGAGTLASTSLPVPASDFDGDQRTVFPDIGADEVHKTFVTLEPIGALADTTTVVDGVFQVRESAAADSVTATIHRTALDVSEDKLVEIVNPDVSVFSLPSDVLIPANSRTATFTISTVDDGLVEDSKDFLVRGNTVDTFGIDSLPIRVVDDDRLPAQVAMSTEHKINHLEIEKSDVEPDVAWINDDTYVVVWYTANGITSTDTRRILARLYDKNDVPLGDQFSIFDYPSDRVGDGPRVTSDGTGSFVVAYPEIEFIPRTPGPSLQLKNWVTRRFDASGTPVTAPSTTVPTDRQDYQYFAMNDDGGWTFVYRNISIGEVLSHRYAADGTLVGTPTLLSGYQSPVDQVAADGSYATITRTFSSATAQRVAADQTPLTQPFPLSTVQIRPETDVASLDSGDFFVTYIKTAGGVFVRQFHRDGLAAADEVMLNDSSIDRLFDSKIAVSPDQTNVVVTWRGRVPGDVEAILARSLEIIPPKLEVSSLQEVAETVGSVPITVTRAGFNTQSELVVTVTPSDAEVVTAPATVVIPAGADSVTFQLQIVDDQIATGDRSASVLLQAGNIQGSLTVTSIDDEIPEVSIRFDEAATMEGTAGVLGFVTRNTPPLEDLHWQRFSLGPDRPEFDSVASRRQ